MRWDLEERTEDAIVSYLKTVVDGSIRVAAAWELNEPEYPCIIVHCGATTPVSDPAEWHDDRVLAVVVSVVTEALDELNAEGELIRKARERNADVRSSAMDALAISDLKQKLVDQEIEAIAFSEAQLTTTARPELVNNHFVGMLNIEVIAEPVTGS